MRHAAKRDECEPAIVAALRAAGYAVAKMSMSGVPDLLVYKSGVVHLLECKDAKPGRKAHKRSTGVELTEAQVKWWKDWTAAGGKPPIIVRSVDEALAVIKGIDPAR